MRIRPATSGDVDAVVALVESAYRGDSSRAGWTTEADLLGGQRTDTAQVAGLVPFMLIADDETRVVGCCTVVPKDGHAYFGLFAVQPQLQSAGVGSALLAGAEACAVEQGESVVQMTVLAQRTELIAFYERRGYLRTGGTQPFPYGDERFGLPRQDDLHFVVLAKHV